MPSELSLNVLDRLKIGAAIVDEAGRILSHNASYESSLQALGLLAHEPLGRIEAAIQDMTRQRLGEAPEACRLLELGSGSQLVMQRFGESSGDAAGRRTVLIVYALDRHPIPERGILRDLFKLSPAEAGVAERVCAGQSVAEIAQTKTTEHTVRAHLKHIFQKTKTSTQGSLAHKLRRCSLLTGPPETGVGSGQLR